MKKFTLLKKAFVLVFLSFLSFSYVNSQCMLYEVPLVERINQSNYIIEGEVLSQSCFWDAAHQHIYTSNIVELKKVFKGSIETNQVEIITQGGVMDNQMEIVNPSLKLQIGEIGIFFGNVSALNNNANLVSLDAYADEQGFVKYSKLLGKAFDHFTNYDIYNELYYNITRRTNQLVEKISFDALEYVSNTSLKSHSISSISPTSLAAGKKDVLTITGSGFGASKSGSAEVLFRAADNGGSGLVICPTDHIISWSDTEIKCYVPSGAGTGGVRVQDAAGVQSSDSPTLTVNYNLTNLGATGSPVGIMINSTTGYNFKYSNNTANTGVSFADHTNAKARFEDALQNWRCNTGFNAFASGTATTINASSNDGEFVVMFDNASAPLASGVLGTGHSYYSNTGCEWMVVDIDVRFKRNATDGVTWYFGANAGSQPGSETDFQSVAIHEIGHTFQQGHTINTSDPMNYSLTTGTNTRVLTSGNTSGGQFVISNGTGKLVSCPQDPMEAYSCTLPPVAAFSANTVTSCNSTLAVNFTDASTYTPTSWAWDFGDGNTSTAQNPSHTYTSSGTYTVTLTATNANGNDSEIKTNYISVGVASSLPVNQAFESATFVPSAWNLIQTPTDATTWERYTGSHANGSSTACTRINGYDYATSGGELDALETENITLAGTANPKLTFKVAYQYYPSSSNYDEFRVYVSTDCGATYSTALYNKNGPTLATAGSNSSSAFVPTSSGQWRTETIDLTAYIGNNIKVKFEFTNRYGQVLYVDDIAVFDDCTTSISGTTPASRCGTGTVDLGATASAGDVKWYAASTGGTSLFTGTSYTTPSISTTTSYWAEAVYGTCASARTEVIATVETCVTQLKPTSCGVYLNKLSDNLYITKVTSATQYRYLVENASLSYSQVKYYSADTLFRMSWMTGLISNTTYTVKVSVKSDGVWYPYGTSCNVTTPGNPKMKSIYNGITLVKYTDNLYCEKMLGATQYRYLVENTSLSYSQEKYYTADTLFRMSWMSGLQNGTTYTIKVAYKVNNRWQAYGQSISITTPIDVKLQTSSCNITLSNMAQNLYALKDPNASQYRYLVENTSLSYSQEKYYTADTLFRMSWMSGLLNNTGYTVKVSVKVNGSWQPYGTACTVTTPASGMIVADVTSMAAVDLTSYPNPSDGTFTIHSSHEGTFNIINELGQLIQKVDITKENNFETKIEGFATGIYFVTGTVNNEVVTNKIVVQ